MTPLIVAAFVIAQTAGSQSTGYPECDKFIQMVTECINTTMPPSARADRRQELDAFRGALSFIPGSMAAEKCAENIKLEMQRDRYGCYAAHAAKAGVQTPCSLVTAADLQQVLTTAYQDGQPGSSKRTHLPSDGAARPVTIEVRWTGGREELEAARSAQKQMDQALRTSARKSVVPGKHVPGLGDDAFLMMAGFMPMLYARKGEAAVSVTVPATEAELIAIARKALERLR